MERSRFPLSPFRRHSSTHLLLLAPPLMLMLLLPPVRSDDSGASNALWVQAQKTWCVAKPSSDEAALQQNIDFACSQVDCSVIQGGCACYHPDTRINHASVAMNIYYQAKGRNYWNCHFKASGLVVQTDPSYGNCLYA